MGIIPFVADVNRKTDFFGQQHCDPRMTEAHLTLIFPTRHTYSFLGLKNTCNTAELGLGAPWAAKVQEFKTWGTKQIMRRDSSFWCENWKKSDSSLSARSTSAENVPGGWRFHFLSPYHFTTVNEHTTTMNIDFGVIHKFQQVSEFANTESSSNEYQLCNCTQHSIKDF